MTRRGTTWQLRRAVTRYVATWIHQHLLCSHATSLISQPIAGFSGPIFVRKCVACGLEQTDHHRTEITGWTYHRLKG